MTDRDFAALLVKHLPPFDSHRLQERLASGERFSRQESEHHVRLDDSLNEEHTVGVV